MSLWKALRGKPGTSTSGAGKRASALQRIQWAVVSVKLLPLTTSKRAAAMQRIQWALGIGTTAAIAFIWWNGFLDKFERDSIDARAKTFASANAHPSDRIAVIAIDDAAIDNVGRWPWDREKLAAVIDELTNAGVSVVALDILLDDPQRTRPEVEGDKVRLIPDDEILGAALKRHGRVVTAVSFKFTKAEASSDVLQADLPSLYELMEKHPELACQPWEIVGDQVKALLPGFKDLPYTKGKEIDKLRLRWEAAVTLASRGSDSSFPIGRHEAPWAISTEPGVPIRAIADASRRLANVTFDSYDPDGLTRRIPVVVQHNGRLWPTLGVAAAFEFLSVHDKDVTINPETLGLITPDGDARQLAIYTRKDEAGYVAGLHLVSWPRALTGGNIPVTGWQRQLYDASARRPAEVPIGRVYEPARLALAVNDNWTHIRNAVEKGYRPADLIDSNRLARWQKADLELKSNPIDSPPWRAASALARSVLKAAGEDAQFTLDLNLDGTTLDKLPEKDRVRFSNMIDARKAIDESLRAIDAGVTSIIALRHELRQRLAGTVCFVGWTATGSLADFVATSIDPRTPGVHVHAAVCNSILTGYQRVPGSVLGQLMVILALGLVGTWIGVRSSVVGGPLLVLGALALWAAFACIVLWGMYDAVWSIAGPTAAAAAGWLVVVLHRLLVEQRSRRKTEERFKSYVSPAVVDILVENPSLSSMAPQQKELTVLFTDIAGFTTTAERLGSQGTAELLAVFLGTMTEIVQRHSATLDKYIGDAIMAFWGAPIDDPLHARHACTAAVEMMNTLDRLNNEKAFGAAGALKVRIGLATGDLMVGDFGNPPRNSSYTVIGDTANLSSRLEGASKVFGTRTLVSDLTRALAGEGFLWRRIGLLKVKGKQSGIWVHELLPGQVKGEKTAEWLALCEELIADYQAERFEQALGKAVKLRVEYHDEGFASAYGEAIAARQAGLAEGDFDGSITLTEK